MPDERFLASRSWEGEWGWTPLIRAIPSCLMDLDRMGEIVREHFERDLEVVTVYLFGSLARREERPESDVDLGVLYACPPHPRSWPNRMKTKRPWLRSCTGRCRSSR